MPVVVVIYDLRYTINALTCQSTRQSQIVYRKA
jgi:hypothetical protein